MIAAGLPHQEISMQHSAASGRHFTAMRDPPEAGMGV